MLICLTLPAGAQIQRLWEKAANLKGHVRSATEYRSMVYTGTGRKLYNAISINYNEQGAKVSELLEFDTANSNGNHTVYTYEGELLRRRDEYVGDGKTPDEVFFYAYKKNKRETIMTSEGTNRYTEIWKHDDAGRIVEITSFYHKDNVHKDTYKYDSKGNRIEASMDYTGNWDASGAPQKMTYKYDDLGNAIETNFFNSDTTYNLPHIAAE